MSKSTEERFIGLCPYCDIPVETERQLKNHVFLRHNDPADRQEKQQILSTEPNQHEEELRLKILRVLEHVERSLEPEAGLELVMQLFDQELAKRVEEAQLGAGIMALEATINSSPEEIEARIRDKRTALATLNNQTKEEK